MKIELIDGASLLGAVLKSYPESEGSKIPIYDEGSGDLYISRDSMGINGIVRADSWEDAYGICEDEFFPPADESWEEMAKTFDCEGEELMEDAAWNESYGFRPNGESIGKDKESPAPGIYSKDLNGDYLDVLTDELAKSLGITLDIELDEETMSDAFLDRDIEWGDSHGQYIPQIFAQSLPEEAILAQSKELQSTLLHLRAGRIDEESYWEEWVEVLDGFEFEGRKLNQTGDLWSYSVEGLASLVEKLEALEPVSNVRSCDVMDSIWQ
tara:strand:- start:2807 stop:3610 length:804 start_codon:yes stop_codon:yes gene_type:complete